MRMARIGIVLAWALLCVGVEAFSQEQRMTVVGKLTRAVAIGGESTGWAIQLESDADIGGKPVNTIEIASRDSRKLEQLQDKRVRAVGRLSYRSGVETGRRPVLDISSMEETAQSAPGRSLAQLFGRIWQVTETTSKPASGGIYVFLPNGTLLETSCVETYRIARWSVDKKNNPSVLRVVEDGQLAFTAVITGLTSRKLQLRKSLAHGNETRNVTLNALEREFVCPDLPNFRAQSKGSDHRSPYNKGH